MKPLMKNYTFFPFPSKPCTSRRDTNFNIINDHSAVINPTEKMLLISSITYKLIEAHLRIDVIYDYFECVYTLKFYHYNNFNSFKINLKVCNETRHFMFRHIFF